MISVIIITKNEALNIQACLESVKWADEIIIVDAFSEDQTLAIVKNYTDKIFIREWQGYGNAKNYAIEQASGNWILSVDADERITEVLREEIVTMIKTDAFCAYRLPRLTYFCGKPLRFGGCYPDWQTRLFKKNYGKFDEAPVHESLIITRASIEGIEGFGYLRNHLLHYSYSSITEYWERSNKYSSLAAQKKFTKGKKFYSYHFFSFFWGIFHRLFIKLGILDGLPGIFYHVFSAMSSFIRYAKLWELYQISELNEHKARKR